MRTLSLTQPWPWIILNLAKDVENRVWSTKHRGPFLIHAAKGASGRAWLEAYTFVRERVGVDAALRVPASGSAELLRGGIVGVATIYGALKPCSAASDACGHAWHMHEQHGFLLRDVWPLPFLAVPGRQRWFNVEHPALANEADGSTGEPS